MCSKTVSVVIPCFRSEKTIEKVVRMTRQELLDHKYNCEFVLVNDASPDRTFHVLARLHETIENVTSIDLARNFGQHGAILCGLHHVSGDIVVLMDDDMQTHPSQVCILLEALEQESVDVVFGRYPKRREAAWRQLGSMFWRWTMQVMTGCPADIELTSFIAMKGWVAREIASYAGPFPVVQGLVFRTTFHVVNADVKHYEREVGSSGYTLKALVRLWSNALNFSMMPLRLSTAIGGAMGCIGMVAAIIVVIKKLLNPDTPVGWSSLMVVLLVCSGIILIALGIVGEYIGRVFMTSNGTPQFVERIVLKEGQDG